MDTMELGGCRALTGAGEEHHTGPPSAHPAPASTKLKVKMLNRWAWEGNCRLSVSGMGISWVW